MGQGFGQGLLQGFQVADNYLNRQELMQQHREDRALASYDRGRTEFGNAYNDGVANAGSAKAFVDSGGFDKLVLQNKDNPFINKLVNIGKNSGSSKLKDIRINSHGQRAFIVDSYDGKGKLVSENRAVTNSRDSLESNPSDNVTLMSGEQFHDSVLSALSADSKYTDRLGVANRVGDTMDAITGKPTGLTGTATPQTTQSSPLGASVASGLADSPPTQAQTHPTTDVKSTPPPKILGSGEPKNVTADLQKAQNLPSPELSKQLLKRDQLKKKVSKLLDERRALMEGGDAPPGVSKLDLARKISALYKEIDAISNNHNVAEYDYSNTPDGTLTAKDYGTAMRGVIGDIPSTLAKAIPSWADTKIVANELAKAIPSWADTKIVADELGITGFVTGLLGLDESVAPEGTKNSEKFSYKSDGQAKNTMRDGGKPKPQSPAQSKKISNVMSTTATAVNNSQKVGRKMLADYRKALRAQILHGDITAKEAIASYYEVLKGSKASNKYKISLDSTNGLMVKLNQQTGDTEVSRYGTVGGGGGTNPFRVNPSSKDGQKFLKERETSIRNFVEGRGFKRGEAGGYASVYGQVDELTAIMGMVQPNQVGYASILNQALDLQQAYMTDGGFAYFDLDRNEVPPLAVFAAAVKRGVGTKQQFEQFMNASVKPLTAALGRDPSKGELHNYNRLLSAAALVGGDQAVAEMSDAVSSDPSILDRDIRQVAEALHAADKKRRAAGQ